MTSFSFGRSELSAVTVMQRAQQSLSWMLANLKTLVEVESPTTDRNAVNSCADLMTSLLEPLPCQITNCEPDGPYGRHMVVDFGGVGHSVLVVSHIDTVWPLGTISHMPFRVEGDLAFGPGIADMKGGIIVTLTALRVLAQLQMLNRQGIRWLITSDEEIGSPSSRELIEREARTATRVLVTEPADLPNGAVKTRRKGTGKFDIHVTGVSAHSGAAHQDGASAIRELARHVEQLELLTDYEAGTTVNVGVFGGGIARNVVPAQASMSVDLRFSNPAEMERLDRNIRALTTQDPRTSVEVVGGFNRPPLNKTAANEALYKEAKDYASGLGFELPETFGGGASDANLCSAVDVPTLDGLGAVGAGFHAVDERVELSSLPKRAALMALLLSTPTVVSGTNHA